MLPAEGAVRVGKTQRRRALELYAGAHAFTEHTARLHSAQTFAGSARLSAPALPASDLASSSLRSPAEPSALRLRAVCLRRFQGSRNNNSDSGQGKAEQDLLRKCLETVELYNPRTRGRPLRFPSLAGRAALTLVKFLPVSV